MDPKLVELYERLKEKGLSSERERKILAELEAANVHDLPDAGRAGSTKSFRKFQNIYNYDDLSFLQAITALQSTHSMQVEVPFAQGSQVSEPGGVGAVLRAPFNWTAPPLRAHGGLLAFGLTAGRSLLRQGRLLLLLF